jgi:hypothetical protein
MEAGSTFGQEVLQLRAVLHSITPLIGGAFWCVGIRASPGFNRA